MRIDVAAYENIVVLTGAGCSAASGLRTYRGPDGLYSNDVDMSVLTATGFASDPAAGWRVLRMMREAARQAQPNPAHLALARAQKQARGRFTLVTQNVDALHQRAGSDDVVEVHGSIHRSRCTSESCDLPAFDDESTPTEPPRCPRCQAPLRPDVVLFEEFLPLEAEWRVKQALRGCDLFLAVGTSGTVAPASSYVRSAEYEGARTILVNLEPMSPRNPAFQEERLGRAEALLPELFGFA